MDTRTCLRCNEDKPLAVFTVRKTHRPGKPVSECTPCKVERNRQYRIDNRELRLAQERRSKLKCQYDITPEDYDTMLDKQGGGCAICGVPEPSNRTKYFAVDHCHTTGKVRGLLCTKCNRGLGLFNDNTGRMLNAVKYLERNDK